MRQWILLKQWNSNNQNHETRITNEYQTMSKAVEHTTTHAHKNNKCLTMKAKQSRI